MFEGDFMWIYTHSTLEKTLIQGEVGDNLMDENLYYYSKTNFPINNVMQPQLQSQFLFFGSA